MCKVYLSYVSGDDIINSVWISIKVIVFERNQIDWSLQTIKRDLAINHGNDYLLLRRNVQAHAASC